MRNILRAFICLIFAASVGLSQGINVNVPIHQNNKFDPLQPMQSWECSQNMLTLGTPMLIFLTPAGSPGDSVDCNGVIHASGGASPHVLSVTGTVATGCTIAAGDIVGYIAADGGICDFPGTSEEVLGLAETSQTAGQSIVVDVVGPSNCNLSVTGSVNRGDFLIPDTAVGGFQCKNAGSFRLIDDSMQQRIIGKALAAASASSMVPVMLYNPSKYGNSYPAWNNITVQTANTQVNTANFSTSFEGTDGAQSWLWDNATPATSTVPQPSIALILQGRAWNGTISVDDGWESQAGTDFASASSIYQIVHTGGFSGQVSYVQLPALGMVPTAVVALPAAASYPGKQFTVSDSTTIVTEGQPCVGSGTTPALAFSDGTAWKCF